jgi:hypothetical protein
LFVLFGVPILTHTARGLLETLSQRKAFWEQILVFDRQFFEIDAQTRGIVWPLLATFATVWIFNTGAFQTADQFSNKVFPVAAVDWLEKNPQKGEMFNYFPWGGYLLYREWPHMRVFIDGQTDFYGEKLTREYEGIITAEGDWQKGLQIYRVGWAIIPPDQALSKELARTAGWKEVYQDSTAVIWSRAEP